MMPYNRQKTDDFFADEKRPDNPKSRTLYIIILVVLLAAVGGYYAYRYVRFARQPKSTVIADTMDLKLYYPLPPAKLGVRNLPVKTSATDKEKVEAIIAGLKESKVLPPGVSLTEFATDMEGTLLLNFSHELTAMKPDPVTEIQTVYSIINSFLANFNKSKSVQLLAGGQAFFSINGTVYTYKPIEFNSHILED